MTNSAQNSDPRRRAATFAHSVNEAYRILVEKENALGVFDVSVFHPEEVLLALAEPDGRPMVTDVFLMELLEACEDHYDFRQCIRDWVEGDWEAATQDLEK